MISLYKFEPLDTLFFKGAEPMVMGESHSSNLIFPPPIHTIEGAIRTKLMKINEDKYSELINKGKEKPGFESFGPFFIKDDNLYIPTPYFWFTEKDNKETKVIKSKEITTNLIKSDLKNIYWAKGEKGELESLGGTWVKYEDILNNEEHPEILKTEDFFEKEPRTGIALEENRRVRQSHIYSFTHIRLKQNVKLAFGVDTELPFDNNTILLLGAEKRFGMLNKMNLKFDVKEQGDFYINLSIVSVDSVNSENLIATGKPLSLGGWDLYRGFHKPMKNYYPAGSVFNKKINKNFIAI